MRSNVTAPERTTSVTIVTTRVPLRTPLSSLRPELRPRRVCEAGKRAGGDVRIGVAGERRRFGQSQNGGDRDIFMRFLGYLFFGVDLFVSVSTDNGKAIAS